MARTFCNTPINSPGRHECKTEIGTYLMSPYWIDTTCPSDMMDYDFTDNFDGLKKAHEETRAIYNGERCK
jgi:hypothetical protein